MAKERILDTGLSVVYEPECSSPLVDVVFVHGLQGHPYTTWATKEKCTSSNRFWERRRKRTSSDINFEDTNHPPPATKRVARESEETTAMAVGSRVTDFDIGSGAEPAISDTQKVSPAGVFWPADLLPAECPNARIMTWGYDTKITKSMIGATNKGSVFSHAKDLLFGLSRERPIGRRIIFVAHSLGGIVVKDMLSSSCQSEDPALKDVIVSTAAVVFFGTPHRGATDIVNKGEMVRKVAGNILRMDTSAAPLHALGLFSADLERCQEAFARLWSSYDFRVKTFQEGLALSGVNISILGKKVVPDFSSLLGDPRELAETLQANHMDMCRFEGLNDPNYRKVSSQFRDMYRSLLSVNGGGARNQRPASVRNDLAKCDESSACLESLAFPEMNERQGAIAAPIERTCTWLFETDVFKSWLDREEVDTYEGFLWIKGKPGSGKSTLMKAVSTEVAREAEQKGYCVATFFFNAKGTSLERSKLGLLRSLLYQILSTHSSHLESVTTIYRQKVRKLSPAAKPNFKWQVVELEEIMRSIFRERSSLRTVIFVDALDECDESDAREVAFFLRDLASHAHAVQAALDACISSRHFPSITVRDVYRINMECFSRADIDVFVRTKFATAGTPENDQWLMLRNDIVEKSSGIFLWVVLVVDMLLKSWEQGESMRRLHSRLQNVPQALEGLFSALLTNIHDDAQVTVKLFQWAVFALRPLRLLEWHHILAFIRPDKAPLSLEEWRDSEYFTENDDQLERQIRFMSKGLLEVRLRDESVLPQPLLLNDDSVKAGAGSLDPDQGETRIVQVIHESVREFFLHGNGFALLDGSRTWTGGDGHAAIIGTCIDYLQIRELSSLAYARDQAQDRDALKGSSKQMNEILSAPAAAPRGLPSNRGNSRSIVRPAGPDIESPHLNDARVGGAGSVRSFGSAGSDAPPSPVREASHIRDGGRKDTEDSVLKYIKDRYPDTGQGKKLCLDSFFQADSLRPDRWCLPWIPFPEARATTTSSIAETQLLEDFPALLHYCTTMLFRHVEFAGHSACGLTKLVKRLSASWKRYVLLQEDLPHDKNFMVHCAELGLGSCVRCLLASGEAAGEPFAIAHGCGNDKATLLIVLQDIIQPQNRPKHSFRLCFMSRGTLELRGHEGLMYDLVATKQVELFRAWRHQVKKLLADGHIPSHALRAYVNRAGPFGDTPLTTAISRNCPISIVKGLLELGADPNRTLGTSVPLHSLCSTRANPTALSLLLDNGANPNLVDVDGKTPLHYVVSKDGGDSLSWVKELLAHGAEVNVKDRTGTTPVHYAIQQRDIPVIEFLLENGAKVAPGVWTKVALYDGKERSRRRARVMELLLTHGADASIVGQGSQTALHIAAYFDDDYVVDLLLRFGADPNARDVSGDTPLYLACSKFGSYGPNPARVECVRTLLRAGANVFAQNKAGKTPIDIVSARRPYAPYQTLFEILSQKARPP